jgi:hypothetical protein
METDNALPVKRVNGRMWLPGEGVLAFTNSNRTPCALGPSLRLPSFGLRINGVGRVTEISD